MEKILVLGGCGYVGSHIVENLIFEKKEVVVIDDLSTGIRARIPKDVAFFNFNLREIKKLHKVILEGQFTTVIHLAAKKQARESMTKPLMYWEENVGLTISLVKALQGSNVENVVFSSSCSVYGNSGKTNLSTMFNPQSTYARTKQSCEDILKDCSREIGYRLGILRYFNVIGASKFDESYDQATEAVLPTFIRNTLSGKKITVFGKEFDTHDGTAVRDYVDVRDLSRAHTKVIDLLSKGKERYFECLVSTGNPRSVLELAQEVFNQTGINGEISFSSGVKGDPAKVWSELDTQLHDLGWRPEYSFSESVESQVNSMLIKLGSGKPERL
jgi:UDP-glucose 4-epimerase